MAVLTQEMLELDVGMMPNPRTDPNDSTTPRFLMTEADFVDWCDEDTHAEWVDGEVVMHSPVSYKHVDVVRFLLTTVGLYVIQRQLGVVCGPELQVRLPTVNRRRMPDLLFVSEKRREIIKANHIEGAPDLAMEVVSLDSLARDWREKYWEYETAGVQEYWVIDPLAQHIEAYALGAEHHYVRLPRREGIIRSTILSGLYLKPVWLWQDPLPNPLDILREWGAL